MKTEQDQQNLNDDCIVFESHNQNCCTYMPEDTVRFMDTRERHEEKHTQKHGCIRDVSLG